MGSIMTAKVQQQPPPPYSELPPGSTQENYQPISTEASFNHQHACKIIITVPILGPNPVMTMCMVCRKRVQTRVYIDYSSPMEAWIIGSLLCFFGCWCLSCIPCCLMRDRDISHMCPYCNRLLGTYQIG